MNFFGNYTSYHSKHVAKLITMLPKLILHSYHANHFFFFNKYLYFDLLGPAWTAITEFIYYLYPLQFIIKYKVASSFNKKSFRWEKSFFLSVPVCRTVYSGPRSVYLFTLSFQSTTQFSFKVEGTTWT